MWERRIAIVATQFFICRGDFGDTLRLAGLLLGDREDLIHKAAGWMLREVGKRDQAVLEGFLARHCRPVVAYDRLGFGRSSRRERLPDAAFIREEAETFLPAVSSGLGITDFAALGHSVGGCGHVPHRERADEVTELVGRFPPLAATRGLCGFVEASVRPMADGCTTHLVGYVEGWFVDPDVRRHGVGRKLVEAAQVWASSQGCREMASDAYLENATRRFRKWLPGTAEGEYRAARGLD